MLLSFQVDRTQNALKLIQIVYPGGLDPDPTLLVGIRQAEKL
jgi:hypothetical protein